MYTENDWRDYLAHSGVLGMKWYVRMGPPYPLKPEQHSASEKKAGWQKSLPSNKVRGNGRKGGLVRDIVNEIRISKYEKERSKSSIDPETGLRKKTTTMSMEDDAKRVNPESVTGDIGYNMNCAFCSMTYDLRRRGFDVKAGSLNDGMYENDIASMYKGKNGFKTIRSAKNTSLKVRSQAVEEQLLKQGDGARGIITVSWDSGGGHAMAYEVSGKKLNIVEAQHGYIYSDSKQVFNRCLSWDINYLRTDNLVPNYDKMKKKGVVE